MPLRGRQRATIVAIREGRLLLQSVGDPCLPIEAHANGFFMART